MSWLRRWLGRTSDFERRQRETAAILDNDAYQRTRARTERHVKELKQAGILPKEPYHASQLDLEILRRGHDPDQD